MVITFAYFDLQANGEVERIIIDIMTKIWKTQMATKNPRNPWILLGNW